MTSTTKLDLKQKNQYELVKLNNRETLKEIKRVKRLSRKAFDGVIEAVNLGDEAMRKRMNKNLSMCDKYEGILMDMVSRESLFKERFKNKVLK